MVGLIFFSAVWFAFIGLCWYFLVRLELYKHIPKINTFETFSKVQGVFQGIVTLLLGVGSAVIFWYFRDQAKHIDQEHTERDLQIKEKNDAWKNFLEYQKTAENSEISEGTRATAIYALGEYYTRPLDSLFPLQVHSFFRSYINNFWNTRPEYVAYQKKFSEYKNQKHERLKDQSYEELISIKTQMEKLKIPEYIQAVYRVIQDKSQKVFHIQVMQTFIGIKHKEKLNLFHSKNGFLLNEINLFKANLRAADFRKVDLREADLRKANLYGTNFRKANLSGADLGGTNIEGEYLLEMTVWWVNSKEMPPWGVSDLDADLVRANFGGADLREADLRGTNLERTNLCGTNLRGANLRGANLRKANLTATDLRRAILKRADLREAKLWEADLRQPILARVHSIGADFGRVILGGVDLRNVIFSGTHSPGTNFREADLKKANLSGVDLRRAILEKADLRGANLRKANLRRAVLREANLRNAVLRKTNLTGAILYGTELLEVKQLNKACLINARYDDSTKFPDGFDPKKAGMIHVP